MTDFLVLSGMFLVATYGITEVWHAFLDRIRTPKRRQEPLIEPRVIAVDVVPRQVIHDLERLLTEIERSRKAMDRSQTKLEGIIATRYDDDELEDRWYAH